MARRTTILFCLLSAIALTLFVCDIVVGSVNIPFSDVVGAISGSADATTRAIVVDIRLTKALMALFAGIALSLSGLQMQTLFRNPLAGPYVLGVSSGASFGVALFLLGAPLLGLSSSPIVSAIGTTGAAWIGAAAVLMMIIVLSKRIKDIMVILFCCRFIQPLLGVF